MDTLQAILIAVIEGLTEYLPISSTAHMGFTASILGMNREDEFLKMFMVSIQFGAILSVVVEYWLSPHCFLANYLMMRLRKF